MDTQRYPETTIKTYTTMMSTFLKFVSPKEARECDAGDLIRIVYEYIIPSGLSNSFQNQMISSVKKFYSKIYRSVVDPGELTRPRMQHRLPNVLSKVVQCEQSGKGTEECMQKNRDKKRGLITLVKAQLCNTFA